MPKTILVTGATDGIGRETAGMLISKGHQVLLHGRNPAKLKEVEGTLSGLSGGGRVESYVTDLSRLADVEALANAVADTGLRSYQQNLQHGEGLRDVANVQSAPGLSSAGRVAIRRSSSLQSKAAIELIGP